MTDVEFDEFIDTQRDAPTCGSCLLMAENLLAHAVATYTMTGGRVYPPKPVDSWRDMLSTRWPNIINIAGFVNDADLPNAITYERIPEAFNEKRVERWTAELEAENEEYVEMVQERRDAARAAPGPSPEPP